MHIEIHPLYLLHRGREASDHLVGRYVPLPFGLEGDEDAAVVLGDGRAARPDISDRRGDCGVVGSDLEDRLLPLLHPIGRDILGRFADTHNDACVLLREEALGDDDEEPERRGDGREHDDKRDPTMSQSDDQAAIIDVSRAR